MGWLAPRLGENGCPVAAEPRRFDDPTIDRTGQIDREDGRRDLDQGGEDHSFEELTPIP